MNILYTTPGCPKCQYAKHLLSQSGFPYEVSQNIQEAIGKGISSAPTLVTEDGVVHTFQEIVKLFKEQREERGE